MGNLDEGAAVSGRDRNRRAARASRRFRRHRGPLTLNRPQARNSLSEALIAAPADQLTAIAADRWAQNCREVGAGGEARRGEMIACNQRVDRVLDVNDGAQVIYI
jgi:hypothetical protein